MYDCDLLVIGSGSGGQRAAIAAAKLGERVCLAERRNMMGGVCVNTGTIPSKTLREAVLAGLAADGRGRITVDGQYRTAVGHIVAVGDVIGFPALAATAMDQGRLAAYHAFGEPARELRELQPIGIYTVPEISYCGKTEAQLTTSAVPYEVGMSRYRELARGAIVGDSYGMLKLLVSTQDRTLLGVHIFGTNATDLIHIGQAIMGCGGTVDYLIDTVLNYPTLSEAYKVAALDATNKIRALDTFTGSG